MLNTIEKPWGWSTSEVVHPWCEVHRIDVRRGGFCSWHQHQHKDNVFSIASGRLVIESHNRDGDIVQLVLQPGDTYTVHAGIVHRFRSPFEPVRAFEVYYPRSSDEYLSSNDIIRYSHGGTNANAGGDVN